MAIQPIQDESCPWEEHSLLEHYYVSRENCQQQGCERYTDAQSAFGDLPLKM
jgi:hypothetical protein